MCGTRNAASAATSPRPLHPFAEWPPMGCAFSSCSNSPWLCVSCYNAACRFKWTTLEWTEDPASLLQASKRRPLLQASGRWTGLRAAPASQVFCLSALPPWMHCLAPYSLHPCDRVFLRPFCCTLVSLLPRAFFIVKDEKDSRPKG